MECYETTTATGEGFWGKAYRFKLIRRQLRYTSRFGPQERELVDYGLYFQESAVSRWDRRIFASEEERAAFIARGITDLHLTALSQPITRKTPGLFAGLIGDRLSSVTFVADYVQMHFDNKHSFNFYDWPVLYEGQVPVTHEQDIYPRKLVGLIGKAISSADEYLDMGIYLEFEAGPWLTVPLRLREDSSGYEVAEYWGDDEMVSWSPGEPPFE